VLFDGGVRAGKTFLTILWLIVFALKTPGVFILIGRRFFEHCRKSLYIQTIDPLLAQFPPDFYKANKIDWIIQLYNGSQIWLGGFDDSRRITEIMGREYLMAFLNEATEIEQEMIGKVKTRLAQKVPKPDGGYYKPRLFFDCNPVDPEFHLNKRFMDMNGDKARLGWTVWDNKDNLTEDYIAELEASLSPQEKERLMAGLWVGSGLYIYPGINESRIIEETDGRKYTHLVGGIDWGTISAFSLWGINDNKAVCLTEVHAKEKITSEFLEEIKDEIETKGFDLKTFPVYCDHEPDRIAEARRSGLNAKKAYKDVCAGDNTVNWFNVRILKDCVNTYRSLHHLQNSKDRNGNVVEGKHVKVDDHAADAARYALHSHRMEYQIKPRKAGVWGTR